MSPASHITSSRGGRALFDGTFTDLITPFTTNGDSIDFAQLNRQLETQAVGGVAGVVVGGRSGETSSLRLHEFEGIIERDCTTARNRDLTAIADVSAYDTGRAVDQQRFASRNGAHAGMHDVPMFRGSPAAAEIERHFKLIADASDLPVVIADAESAIDITTAMRLSQHPNIQAIAIRGDVSRADLFFEQTTLAVLAMDDALALPMLSVGACGVVSVLSNLLPGRVAAMVDFARRGRLRPAHHLHRAFSPLNRAIASGAPHPVPIKCAMAIAGRDHGTVRAPLLPIDVDSRQRLAAFIEAEAMYAEQDERREGTAAETDIEVVRSGTTEKASTS